MSKNKHNNRLADETSPYLLQHAHNPVDWFPWGSEALEKAQTENKPILLSIGYSACHWCHVMERESFENEDTAAFMNQHFVNIKVDREERPDLDEIYMAATVTMNHGRGGWPMTVFLTPQMRPFFAGTYFPPTDRHGMPGFPSILRRMTELWETKRDQIEEESRRLADHLAQQSQPNAGGIVGEREIDKAVETLESQFDATFGGFGPAPKFPPSTALSLLLRTHHRTGQERPLEMVIHTLDAMAAGGMFDHIGGGFARYSTDERWLAPHFEKMLYDNALLTKVYLEAWQVTGDPLYRRVATQTLDFVLAELTDEAGGFYSALDADSEGVEGKFYVWSPAEISKILGEEDGKTFCTYYDITVGGNWEGQGIPNRIHALGAEEELSDHIATLRGRVYAARNQRVRPGLDDKILTAWNGMMIGAFAEGGRVLAEPRYLAAAKKAADFILEEMTDDGGRLLRTWRQGRAHLQAYLEDYAFLAEGLLDLYEASGEATYLENARKLALVIRADYSSDDNEAFSTTARDHEKLILRRQEGFDGATPAPNAVAALTLTRLSYHTGDHEMRAAALGAIGAHSAAISSQPRGFCKTLIAVDWLLMPPVEIVVAGTDALADELWGALASRYLPNRILARMVEKSDLPLLEGKDPDVSALYICQNFVCAAPISDLAQLDEQLANDTRERADQRTSMVGTRTTGFATPAATRAFADTWRDRGLSDGYAELGATGLQVSRIGFGAYRVDDRTQTHRDALEAALTSGCNLIDTSTNYADGRSERMIGTQLNRLIRSSAIAREQLVVVTKVGYLQGENMALARARDEAGTPFKELVRYSSDVWHCMHPEFLADQLERSRARLQLDTIDVLLLHNPEYFLSAEAKNNGDLDQTRDEFYRRMTEAFRYLETQVEAGVIGAYGVSSNTVAASNRDSDATDLLRMLEAAQTAGGEDHHFQVLQLPLNLLESDGALRAKHSEHTVLQLAEARRIGVLVNRPLNAITPQRMIRLADFPKPPDSGPGNFESRLERLAEKEAEFRRDIAPGLEPVEGGTQPDSFFRWAETLQKSLEQLDSRNQWHHVMETQIGPQLGGVLRALDQHLHGDAAKAWASWRGDYLPILDAVLAAVDLEATQKSQARSDRVAAPIRRKLPVKLAGENLSRIALWTLASTPGVSSVLTGMRKTRYVEDATTVLGWPLFDNALELLEAANGAQPMQ